MRLTLAVLTILLVSPAAAQESCGAYITEGTCNSHTSCTWSALGAGPAGSGVCRTKINAFIVSTVDGNALQITLSDPAQLASVLQQLSASKAIKSPQTDSQITVQLKGFSAADMKVIQDKLNSTPPQGAPQ